MKTLLALAGSSFGIATTMIALAMLAVYLLVPNYGERRLICSDHFGFGEDAVGNGTSFSVEPASSK